MKYATTQASSDVKPWPYPAIVAHRGGGNLAPENTLAAIDTAVRYGHTMIEFDVKLSQDDAIFLLHDDTLERTSNGQGIAGHLCWRQLQQLDAGSWFSDAFRGESLPLLSQVAQRCRQHDIMANIEIKPGPGTGTRTGQRVASAACTLWQGMTPPLISSFDLLALRAAQQTAAELPRGLLLDKWRDDWQSLTDELDCLSVHLNHQLLDPQRIGMLQRAGLRILAYTVNHAERAAELLRLGVDCICTDRIDIINADLTGQVHY